MDFFLDNVFTKSEPLPTADGAIDSIYIEGYASTTDIDRAMDVIPSSVWEEGIKEYLKNPIILAYHDHEVPVGRMVDYRVDSKGLWIKARISAAAEDVFNLIKDGVMTAFSVGFRVEDAEYLVEQEVFVIKKLQLLEVSVVSVPANQNTLFNVTKKALSNYKLHKGYNMDKIELERIAAEAAEKAAVAAAEKAAKAFSDKMTAEKAAAEAAANAEKELQERIKAAVAAVTPTETGAEKLLAEVEKRFAEQAESTKSVIAGLEAALKEKAAEIEAIQKSKMQFSNDSTELAYADKEKAVLLGKILGKSVTDTKFGAQVIQKAGPHVASATWELEVSRNLEAEVRRRLVVAPLVRAIDMQTNVMTIPVNPEAGLATWVANSDFGGANSSGATATHQLKEITLNSYKVATREYLNYEEEEDSLLVLLPIVRDAMVRRVARAVDKAYLLGAASASDPIKGLARYDASASTVLTSAAATVANMRALRKELGAWGLDPSEIRFVVSTEVYYDLLDDTNFLTTDKIGDRATLITGQIGAIGNTPVIVSAEFNNKADGEYGAICVAPANFLAGNQRGMRFDTQELVETQRKVMVTSLRTGLTQLTTNLGSGVAALKWSAT